MSEIFVEGEDIIWTGTLLLDSRLLDFVGFNLCDELSQTNGVLKLMQGK